MTPAGEAASTQSSAQSTDAATSKVKPASGTSDAGAKSPPSPAVSSSSDVTKSDAATASATKDEASSGKDTKLTSEKAATVAAATDKSIASSGTANTKVSSAPDKPDVKNSAASDTLIATAAASARPDVKSDSKASAPDQPKPTTTTPPSNKTSASTPPPSMPEAKPRRSVFLPLVFGGVIAGGLGYAASELDLLNLRNDQGTAQLSETLSQQQDRIAALEGAEPTPSADLSAFEDLPPQISALRDDLSAQSASLAEIDSRLTAVEKRPITGGTSEEAIAAYERELAALQSSVAEQRREIEGLLDNALSVEEATANAAQTAAIQSGLTRITAAINDGQLFESALAELRDNGISDVPEALTATAETGVKTLNSLQSRFPDSARATLSAARAEAPSDNDAGFGGFLRRQLGARSVAPREGNDPDAVLSRAEAAVRDGRLDDAIAELDTLPEAARGGINDWLADAQARQAAKAAVQDLSDRLTATKGN